MNQDLLVAVAGLLAGAMNAIAGGGSFVTLPALIAAGVPALHANATSTVALVPSALASAAAYRQGFPGFDGVRMRTMVILSIVGGALGAILLLVTPGEIFERIFPFLLLFGALVFAFGRRLGEILRARMEIHPKILPAMQLVLGIYGGYFGGAVGIMMLATWSVLTRASLNTMQATRHVLNASMNATASILMIAGGLVHWRPMAVLLATSTLGGWLASRWGRTLDQSRARLLISLLNATIVALIFWRRWG